MKNPLIIILFQGFFLILAYGQELKDDRVLSLHPEKKHDVYTVKKGQKLLIQCIFNDSHDQLRSGPRWINDDTRQEIDGETSAKLFTVKIVEGKLTLVIYDATRDSGGEYTCEAQGMHNTYSRTVRVEVLESVQWNQDDTVVGGLDGERLDFDCGATGEPTPEIRITDENGLPPIGAEFIIDGTFVIIPKLGSEYHGRRIICNAFQFEDADHNAAEQKEYLIEVWYSPQFSTPSFKRYAILKRDATMECKVDKSYPPVKDFRFYKNGEQLDDNGKYRIVVDLNRQAANLTVIDVDEEDTGLYVCSADNGKATSDQNITLDKADPPGEVKVSYEYAKDTSIAFKIEQANTEDIPIIAYIIRYLAKSHLENGKFRESAEEEKLWNAIGGQTRKIRARNGLYEIVKLQNNTEYVFRISAENEAGVGKDYRIIAATNSGQGLDGSPGASARSLVSWVLIFALTLLL